MTIAVDWDVKQQNKQKQDQKCIIYIGQLMRLLLLTVKQVQNSHSKIDKTNILMTNGSLMKVESIAKSSLRSILQYFLPALSDNWSWKPICVFFESDHFTQVLLYNVGLKSLY